MRTKYAIPMLALFLGSGSLFAQTTIFSQDFESVATDMFVNYVGIQPLEEDQSTCGVAGRGVANDFNSTNVDFMSAENSTEFMAYNPEYTCGGFSNTTVQTDTMDLSGLTTAYFNCDYFVNTGIGWGGDNLSVTVHADGMTEVISFSNFSATNSWTSFSYELDPSMLQDSVYFEFMMGGGDAVGIDNIVISDFDNTITTSIEVEQGGDYFQVYPSMTADILNIEQVNTQSDFGGKFIILNMSGTKVAEGTFSEQSHAIEVGNFPAGTYYILISDDHGAISRFKFVK